MEWRVENSKKVHNVLTQQLRFSSVNSDSVVFHFEANFRSGNLLLSHCAPDRQEWLMEAIVPPDSGQLNFRIPQIVS